MFNAGEICALCPNRSTPTGEHVLPKWLLRRWPDDAYTVDVSGVVVERNRGGPRKAQRPPQPRLPMCEPCNQWLNETFEIDGRPAVETVLDGRRPLTGSECESFGRWCAKTLVLLRHPDGRSTFEGAPSLGWGVPRAWYQGWRQRDALPTGIHVWAAWWDPVGTGTAELTYQPIVLRSVGEASEGESAGPFESAGLDVNTDPNNPSVRVMVLQVAVSGEAVPHPMEDAGIAVRVHPHSPATFDPQLMRTLSDVGYDQMNKAFAKP